VFTLSLLSLLFTRRRVLWRALGRRRSGAELSLRSPSPQNVETAARTRSLRRLFARSQHRHSVRRLLGCTGTCDASLRRCSQLGLRLGARLNETLRERAEQLAGFALIGLAILLGVEKLS
jgi:hypothetical protein